MATKALRKLNAGVEVLGGNEGMKWLLSDSVDARRGPGGCAEMELSGRGEDTR